MNYNNRERTFANALPFFLAITRTSDSRFTTRERGQSGQAIRQFSCRLARRWHPIVPPLKGLKLQSTAYPALRLPVRLKSGEPGTPLRAGLSWVVPPSGTGARLLTQRRKRLHSG